MNDSSLVAPIIVRLLPGGDLNPYVFWFLGIPVAIITASTFLIWQIAQHKFKYDKNCEETCELKKSSSEIEKKLEKISGTSNAILEMMSRNFAIENKVIEVRSPAKLTAAGKKLLKDVGFSHVFTSHKDFFLNLIMELNPKDESSLDEACWNVLINHEGDAPLETVKQAAYGLGMPWPLVIKVCAIHLREQLKKTILH